MSWSAKSIKILRQRFGWSRAEMARHLGCKIETVTDFEIGTQKPDPECCHQMEHLLSCVEANAQSTVKRARAETKIAASDLDQVYFDEL